MLAAPVDLDRAGIDHHIVDAPAGQGPMQPEAVAASFVAGADRGVGRQPEACLGLGDLGVEPVEVAGQHAPVAGLLGGLGGTGQQPLVLAEFQGDVHGTGRGRGSGHAWVSCIRLRVSYLTETCTTSDTSLPTWYRTTKLTCRGRLQDLGTTENQFGGPGQVQRLVLGLAGSPCLTLP